MTTIPQGENTPAAGESVLVPRSILQPFADAARAFSRAIGPDGIDDELTVMARIYANEGSEAFLSTGDFSRVANALAASSPVRTDADGETLETYYARQIEWSRQTFGPALRTGGVIDHIRKELREIEAEPHDLSEWVDVIILAMDGYWRHGGTANDLMPALLAKQAKNMARTWPDWRTMSEHSAIEHDRSGEAKPEGETGPAVAVERRWIGVVATGLGGPAKVTRLARVAEIWRAQGLAVTEWVPADALTASSSEHGILSADGAREALEANARLLGWEWHADSGRWRRDGGKDEPWWVYAATLEDALRLPPSPWCAALTVSPSPSERDQHQGETTPAAREHGRKVRLVAAQLSAERMQGWANPLVTDLTDAADFLEGVQPHSGPFDVVLSAPEAVPVADKREGGETSALPPELAKLARRIFRSDREVLALAKEIGGAALKKRSGKERMTAEHLWDIGLLDGKFDLSEKGRAVLASPTPEAETSR